MLNINQNSNNDRKTHFTKTENSQAKKMTSDFKTLTRKKIKPILTILCQILRPKAITRTTLGYRTCQWKLNSQLKWLFASNLENVSSQNYGKRDNKEVICLVGKSAMFDYLCYNQATILKRHYNQSFFICLNAL